MGVLRSEGTEPGQLQMRKSIGNGVINAWYVADHYIKIVICSNEEQVSYQVHEVSYQVHEVSYQVHEVWTM